MLNIGCHLSTSKGYKHMGEAALSLGANTFQFFTRNPRGSKAKQIDPKDTYALMNLARDHNFAPLLGHAPYTLNPASTEVKTREFAAMVMYDDLIRMEHLPNNLYNFHPGSHAGQGIPAGISQIVHLLNEILRPEQTTTVLLETMAGKGSEIGASFEELAIILNSVNLPDKMGICMDTCHVFSAGYDLVKNLDGVLDEFDRIVGLDRLKAIHLNDSVNPLGSRKDRHAKIGQGMIGLGAIKNIINHPYLRDLPFYLETPNELPGYAEEIELLKAASIQEINHPEV